MPLPEMEPDRFQKLCQALLVLEYPGLRCFPVGQADGGRDATRVDPRTNGIGIFQVKSARDQGKIRDRSDWLIAAVQEELPKIDRLIARGATSYHLVTNIPGTGALDRGSIDRVNEYLASAIRIPAQCWWGDDLERRLEAHPQLKWQYPELLSGSDVIAQLLETDLSEHRVRREQALRVFMEHQSTTDSTLRFKQTDLHASLFDLFVDVFATIRTRGVNSLSESHEALLNRADIYWPPEYPPQMMLVRNSRQGHEQPVAAPHLPTATLLLNVIPVEHFRSVLEGAPGQGKSTLGQYICQVHRLRLLQRADELAALPLEHRAAPLRLPFRLDLRDFATWVRGDNPFSAESDAGLAQVRSLESLLAASVSQHSGGMAFTVDDLHAVISGRDLVLVLDGLDEVADIDVRRRVVEEVEATIGRLQSSTGSLQVLITSRPAAFANSPGFPEDRFFYLTLTSLPGSLIEKYSTQWVQARGLDDRHGAEVVHTLRTKLSEPHIRDLARNPMQLAILLGLISTRGTSLPDKRTAMYDAYMDVFFSREAEKDELVRQHRDLLLELHGYVAWYLHSRAERGETRGNIGQDVLIGLLRGYLAAEGRDPELAESLFRGAVERVVALVSRVEGTYEFEVQPLREYFCARHLYFTAPLSRVGLPERGAKPDRFDAIARNPYWLNVARFYAGCYSKGELGGLADALEALWQDPDFALTSHPRILTGFLLSDYVFAQSPLAMGRVLRDLLDGLGTRHCLGAEGLPEVLDVLPEECGRADLRRRAYGLLTDPALPNDRLRRLRRLLTANGPLRESALHWLESAGRLTGPALDRWFHIGSTLQVFGELSASEMEPLLGGVMSQRLEALVDAGDNHHYESTPDRAAEAIDLVLQMRVYGSRITARSGRAETLAFVISQLERVCMHLEAERTRGIHLGGLPPDGSGLDVASHAVVQPDWLRLTEGVVDELCNLGIRLLSDGATIWAETIDSWEMLIGKFEDQFGVTPASCALSLLAARTMRQPDIDPSNTTLAGAQSLYRKRQRAAAWRRAFGSMDRSLVLGAFLSFAPPSVVESVWNVAESEIDKLDGEEFAALWGVVRSGMFTWSRQARFTLRRMPKIEVGTPRTIRLLSLRFEDDALLAVITNAASSVRNDDEVREEEAAIRNQRLLLQQRSWSDAVPLIRDAYQSRRHFAEYAIRHLENRSLPLDKAEAVVSAAPQYPLVLVDLAESRLRDRCARSAAPVGLIAERNRWF